LTQLGQLTGYSWQHLGAVERGQVAPAEEVVIICDRVLIAAGSLIARFPAVVRERAAIRHERVAVRRSARPADYVPNTADKDSDADIGARDQAERGVDWERLAACARRRSVVSEAVVSEVPETTAAGIDTLRRPAADARRRVVGVRPRTPRTPRRSQRIGACGE
jgi:hypothetical protein